MAAKTRKELLDITDKEFAKLKALIQPIADTQAGAKDADDTSIKDVIAHRAHWIGLFFGWHSDGLAGKEVHFPAKGYKWSDLKQYNAELRQKQRTLSWEEAKAGLDRAHGELQDFIEGRSDDELYGGPMKGGKNAWTLGRWAEAAGPSHFRSAAKYIRARLRELQ